MEDREVVCDDGVARCPWGVSPPEYRKYHDEEWGRPVGDEDRIYEKLCLEGFQSGLSWHRPRQCGNGLIDVHHPAAEKEGRQHPLLEKAFEESRETTVIIVGSHR